MLYGTIASLRNRLYDRGIFTSYKSRLKTIVIGNLRAGGSGKTPHTAFLFNLLKERYRIGILSRGYGRKTRGLIAADDLSDANSIGDEPYWYQRTLKGATVVVAEKRKEGLEYLERQDVDVVLLDDAYQHRAVTCTVNILLTEYGTPYFKDHVLPVGRLREWKTGDKRAHIIIVTKCPPHLNLEKKIGMIQDINPYDNQLIFFTTMRTLKPYPIKGELGFERITPDKIIAMSGIANPESFIDGCSVFGRPVEPLSFTDHHHYGSKDIQKMRTLMSDRSIVLVTEKDAVKLIRPDLLKEIPENKVFVVPVVPEFLFNEEKKFIDTLNKFLR